MEFVRLHHRDEASVELKVFVSYINSGPGGYIVNIGNRVLAECLGHNSSSGWCGVDEVLCWWRRCGTGGSGSCPTPQDSLWIVEEVFRQVEPSHTLSLFSSITGENKQS